MSKNAYLSKLTKSIEIDALLTVIVTFNNLKFHVKRCFATTSIKASKKPGFRPVCNVCAKLLHEFMLTQNKKPMMAGIDNAEV